MVKELVKVDAIVSYSKGFICSGGSGTLHLFDKIGDDKNTYKKSKTVTLSMDPTSLLTNNAQPTAHNILSLALSPSEENVICATTSQQLYNLAVSTADLGKVSHPHCYIHRVLYYCRLAVVQHLITYHNHFIMVPSLVWMLVLESRSLLLALWTNLLEYGTMRIGKL